jgi:hypothetical protein
MATGSAKQAGLIEIFETAKPANSIYCHQDFLEQVAAHRGDGLGRRAAFLMHRLAVDARRIHYKSTSGVNRGWRRSRLGGNNGSHFYAWWAPGSAVPLQDCPDFPDGGSAIFLRDIRHHDDHSPLAPQSFEAHYLPVSVQELRRDDYAPSPWTPPQSKFATARQTVRVLKGHPGSGKTTALWHAADSTGAERVLYVTYSRDLAALARDYFDRYCSSHKRFDVVTFPALIRQLANSDAPPTTERESRRAFARDLAPFVRNLGAWTNNQAALYDELHAHLVGDALPVAIGRFEQCRQPRVSERAFRERRTRHLGSAATASAMETVSRLDRAGEAPLAARYFPELQIAWQASERLLAAARKQESRTDAGLPDFDCIAIDECQDLTPLEAYAIVLLASMGGRRGVPVLLAGDEAQTVRPTDFEWGWLSDLLHFQLGTPSDHRLTANLRSPKQLAELINKVWDLYGHVQKQERPSGTGYAQIDDDATDQVLYCTAAPGPELDLLFNALGARPGLALITLEDAPPAFIPEAARGSVLTVSEAKGLDFHSVCVIDAGRHIERITRDQARLRGDSDIEDLRKRLAIDQLRVALSRATERLLWLDVGPNDQVVRLSLDFLNSGAMDAQVSSCVPAAVLKTLEEEELSAEERVQRCQSDARQFLEVKPEMAWSRAQQAVTLLGAPGSPAAVSDVAAREAAHLTLAEICFALALRDRRLPAELGRPDLFEEAARAAANTRRYGLAAVIRAVGRIHRCTGQDRMNALCDLAQDCARAKDELEPWLLVEIGSKSARWMEDLESALFNGRNAMVLLKLLPPFYEALGVHDREPRIKRIRQRAIQLFIKEKQYAQALGALETLPEPDPNLEAICFEGLNDFRAAAERRLKAGNRKDALRCYRSIPDFEMSLQIAREIDEHPALDALEWIRKLQNVVEERPDKFTKVVTSAEKKILEDLLERSLGVTRKKPAAKKAPTKRATVKKAAPRKRN